MNAQQKIVPQVEDHEDVAGEVMIHVRFHPNGDVFTIDRRPEGLGLQDWYLRLLNAAPLHYQVRAGGRGFFRIPGHLYAEILAAL